jgi:hypothetical protein
MDSEAKDEVTVDKGTANFNKWRDIGYDDGYRFARQEADYDELAAIVRVCAIPTNWDIFRAEIVYKFGGDPLFDFQAYSTGFACACTELYQKL